MATILIEKDVMVPMRDGVHLATDIYRRERHDPAPVLVTRTPYNKDGLVSGSSGLDLFRAVEAGYVVVVQDVRGRYASEGEFEPMVNETGDGVDTFAWAASQPWSSGVVGTFGGSYLGATQWLSARESPPSLKAMVPSVTFSDMYEGMAFQGGAKVMHDLRWVVHDIVPAELRRRAARGESVPEDDGTLDIDMALNELPLGSHPLIGEAGAFYRRWLTRLATDPAWALGSPSARYDRITAPALNIGGWYDIFTWGTLKNFTEMRARGGSEEARLYQRLIIGPWSHINLTGSFPEREFGPSASHAAIDLGGTQLRWFDRWLRGVENGVEDEAPVKIFVMGIDAWRDEWDWPLPDTRYEAWFLHSGGKANSVQGDGTLSTEPPRSERPDTYLYDPLRPVPTVGGQVLLPGANATGPRDQASVEMRDDVLVYSSPVLQRPVEMTGPIELRLFASSSTRDTDFTGKLVDVFPDGRAIILTDGILRARYRHSTDVPELMEPGEVYELRLDLWETSNVFLPGHRIRLEVSSSNFPRFDRNSNTGGDIATEPAGGYRPAINRIFHDEDHPSRLMLPIIER